MRQELVQAREEDAESRVRELAREVGVIAILELLGDFVSLIARMERLGRSSSSRTMVGGMIGGGAPR